MYTQRFACEHVFGWNHICIILICMFLCTYIIVREVNANVPVNMLFCFVHIKLTILISIFQFSCWLYSQYFFGGIIFIRSLSCCRLRCSSGRDRECQSVPGHDWTAEVSPSFVPAVQSPWKGGVFKEGWLRWHRFRGTFHTAVSTSPGFS